MGFPWDTCSGPTHAWGLSVNEGGRTEGVLRALPGGGQQGRLGVPVPVSSGDHRACEFRPYSTNVRDREDHYPRGCVGGRKAKHSPGVSLTVCSMTTGKPSKDKKWYLLPQLLRVGGDGEWKVRGVRRGTWFLPREARSWPAHGSPARQRPWKPLLSAPPPCPEAGRHRSKPCQA